MIADIRSRLAGVEFDDLYGFTWNQNIIGGAREGVDRSFDCYLRHLGEPTVAI